MTASSASTAPWQVDDEVDRPADADKDAGIDLAAAGSGDADADVIVVGAGPAGSSAAIALARAGIDVLLLEKSTFPRDKVCGDGLTPRGVRQLLALGVDVSGPDWIRNKGLRVVAAGRSLELPWPTLQDYPDFGVVRPRRDFDDLLATIAVKAGARLRVGHLRHRTDHGWRRRPGHRRRREDRGRPGPLPRADRPRLRRRQREGCARHGRRQARRPPARRRCAPLLPQSRARRRRLPRVAPRAVGSVRSGWATASEAPSRIRLDLRPRRRHRECRPRHAELVEGVRHAPTIAPCLRTWLDGTPEEWGLREENALGPIGGAGLPMGFNRTPHYGDGVLLVGDAGGVVNPFNGEGIAYAMESAAIAAESVLQALGRPEGESREAALHGYVARMQRAPRRLLPPGRDLLGPDRQAGDHEDRHQAGPAAQGPDVPGAETAGGLYDSRDGDWADRIVRSLTRMAPSV